MSSGKPSGLETKGQAGSLAVCMRACLLACLFAPSSHQATAAAAKQQHHTGGTLASGRRLARRTPPNSHSLISLGDGKRVGDYGRVRVEGGTGTGREDKGTGASGRVRVGKRVSLEGCVGCLYCAVEFGLVLWSSRCSGWSSASSGMRLLWPDPGRRCSVK